MKTCPLLLHHQAAKAFSVKPEIKPSNEFSPPHTQPGNAAFPVQQRQLPKEGRGPSGAEGVVLPKSATQPSEQLQHLIPCPLLKQLPFCQGTGEGELLQN